MARKPFKVVNDLDLSGNKLVDVREIYRSDYDAASPYLDLIIRAGNDLTNSDQVGGDLYLKSGSGSSRGAIYALLGSSSYGLTILGNSAATLLTENQDVTIATGTAATKITSTVNATAANTGALQVAGGAYIANDLVLGGGDIVAVGATTWNVLNTIATAVNAFGASLATILGSASASAYTTLASTMDASSSTVAGVRVAGGLAVAAKAWIGGALNVNGSTTLGDANTDSTSIRGNLVLADFVDASHTLKIGGDVDLYRSAADVLTIADSLTLGGANLLGPATFNIATSGTSQLNIGTADQQTVINSNLQVLGTIPYLLFDTDFTPNGVGTTAGAVFYDSGDMSLSYIPEVSGGEALVTVNMGQEMVMRCRNYGYTSTVLIPNGNAVAASPGSTGHFPHVRPALASSAVQAAVIGIATCDISANGYGWATSQGIVRGIKFTDIAETGITIASGDLLYLSALEAGKITNVPPASPNYVIRLGVAMNSPDAGATDQIYVLIGESWTTTATYNNLRTNTLSVLNTLIVPFVTAPAQTAEGSLLWDSDDDKLTIGTGAGRITLVDTASSQALTNKTYNALTLTANAVGFSIAGGTTSKTLTLGMNLTVQTGAVTLTGNVAGTSQLVLPAGVTTVSALAADHVLYASAANVISGEAQLAVSRGGTGIGNYAVGDLLYATGATTLAKLVKGGANQLLGMNAAATAPEYKMVSGSSGIVVTFPEAGSMVISTSQSVDPSADISFANMTLSGDLAVNGGDITSSSPSFNLFTTGVTELYMMCAEDAVVNIGDLDNLARTINLHGTVNFGSADFPRDASFYGDTYFGGPDGFTIVWNPATHSIDFIKLEAPGI